MTIRLANTSPSVHSRYNVCQHYTMSYRHGPPADGHSASLRAGIMSVDIIPQTPPEVQSTSGINILTCSQNHVTANQKQKHKVKKLSKNLSRQSRLLYTGKYLSLKTARNMKRERNDSAIMQKKRRRKLQCRGISNM